MRTLTKEEVLSIPDLIEKGDNIGVVAMKLGVHRQTVVKRIQQLRKKGFTVKTRVGRPPVL